MQRFLFAFLLFNCSFFLYGQTRIGLTVSSDYNSQFAFKDDYKETVRDYYRPNLGHSFGIQFSFQKRVHYRFDFGLKYTNFKQQYLSINTFTPIVPNRMLVLEAKQTEQYLSVPCNFNFLLNRGSSQLFAAIGVSPYYFLGSETIYTQITLDTVLINNYTYVPPVFNRIGVGGQITLGVLQNITPHIDFSLAATVNSWVMLYELASTQIFPLAFGMQAGIYYKFNKEKEKRNGSVTK